MMPCPGLRNVLSLLLLLSVCQTTLGQSGSGLKAAPDATIYWIFLTTGKSIQGTDQAEIAKMQAAHLANFARLHKEGRLFTAGPMADPEKKMRGIVVVTAPDLTSLRALFEPDPFVEQGYLTIDAIEMQIAVGSFQGTVDPAKLAEYRLVVLEKSAPDGQEADAEVQSKNLEYCRSIHDTERLCFAAWLTENKQARRAILIFRTLADAQLTSLVDQLPAVKSHTWKPTVYPLYMSEGIVK